MKKLTLSLILASLVGFGQQQSITLTSSAPQSVNSVSVTRVGNQGNTTYYYWVVANWGLGQSTATRAIASFSPDTLTVSNYNKITWSIVQGATSYDVLRTTTPTLAASCTCAVATAQSGASAVNDTGGALAGYTYTPVGSSTATIGLNTTTYARPTVTIDKELSTPTIQCVGTPGNSIGAYRSTCVTPAGGLYICTNTSGCTVAGNWTAVSGGGGGGVAPVTATFTAPSTCTSTGGTGTNSCTLTTGTTLAITHNLTTTTPWISCYDPSGNMLGSTGASTSVISVVATSNNVVTLTFNGSTSGSCVVSTGSMGPTGNTGATGATGPAGANGAISQIQNSGTNLPVQPTLNMAGGGVSCADDPGNTRTVCTVASSIGTLPYWTPTGSLDFLNTAGVTVSNCWVTTTTYPCIWRVYLPGGLTFNNVDTWIQTALGTACTGGTCGLVWGLYADTTSGGVQSVGALLWKSNVFTTSSTGNKTFGSPAAYTAVGGTTYWLAVATDSSTVALEYAGNLTLAGMLVLNKIYNGRCTNAATGNGGSLTLPASCGTPTAIAAPVMYNAVFEP